MSTVHQRHVDTKFAQKVCQLKLGRGPNCILLALPQLDCGTNLPLAYCVGGSMVSWLNFALPYDVLPTIYLVMTAVSEAFALH